MKNGQIQAVCGAEGRQDVTTHRMRSGGCISQEGGGNPSQGVEAGRDSIPPAKTTTLLWGGVGGVNPGKN